MIEITPEPNSLQKTIATLDTLAGDQWIEGALRETIPAMGRINKRQSDALKSLPYSPGYLGKPKPSGKRVAGGTGDLGWGLDTLSLRSDLMFSWVPSGDELVNYSDLVYAGRIDELARQRGTTGLYGEDDEYLAVAEGAIGDAVEGIWRE